MQFVVRIMEKNDSAYCVGPFPSWEDASEYAGRIDTNWISGSYVFSAKVEQLRNPE